MAFMTGFSSQAARHLWRVPRDLQKRPVGRRLAATFRRTLAPRASEGVGSNGLRVVHWFAGTAMEMQSTRKHSRRASRHSRVFSSKQHVAVPLSPRL